MSGKWVIRRDFPQNGTTPCMALFVWPCSLALFVAALFVALSVRSR